MVQEGMVSVTVRIPEELHKACKKKLVDDGKSFVDLVRSAVRQYVDDKFEIVD